MQALDGPTFIASEGWDWIPSVRDRNTGLWQDVVLTARPARCGSATAHVVTTLPGKADNSQADVEITVPVENLTDASRCRPRSRAAFDTRGRREDRHPRAGPGRGGVQARRVSRSCRWNPKLWWPNGYGAQTLYGLRCRWPVDGKASDQKDSRIGLRQMTYELSLMDRTASCAGSRSTSPRPASWARTSPTAATRASARSPTAGPPR
jgi:hypothetical protein